MTELFLSYDTHGNTCALYRLYHIIAEDSHSFSFRVYIFKSLTSQCCDETGMWFLKHVPFLSMNYCVWVHLPLKKDGNQSSADFSNLLFTLRAPGVIVRFFFKFYFMWICPFYFKLLNHWKTIPSCKLLHHHCIMVYMIWSNVPTILIVSYISLLIVSVLSFSCYQSS